MDPNNSTLDYFENESPVNEDAAALPVAAYIVAVVLGVIFLLGLVGNVAVILVYARNQGMRTTVNAYLVSIAVAHLLFVLLILPFVGTVHFLQTFPFGLAGCKILDALSGLLLSASALTLVALTCHLTLNHHASTIVILASMWALGLICALPAMILKTLHHYQNWENLQVTVCIASSELVYHVTTILSNYVIPLCLIAGMYLWQALTKTQIVPNEMRKIVVILAIMFAVCFSPELVIMLCYHISPLTIMNYSEYWHVFGLVGLCLTFASACVNPVALYCMSGAFRKHFNQYLMFWRSGALWTGIR